MNRETNHILRYQCLNYFAGDRSTHNGDYITIHLV